jgi:signal peptidase I
MMQQAQQAYEAKVRRAHLVREIIEVVLLVGIIVFVIHLGVQSYSLNGNTFMKPSLQGNQLVIVSKLTYTFGSPQRGDVIAYNNPLNTNDYRIQRVIGIPGDTVVVGLNSLTVNGKLLKEPYITIDANSDENPTAFSVTLAKNQYFVANDYRSQCYQAVDGPAGSCIAGDTNDSRNYLQMGISSTQQGTLSLDRKYIIGKVVFVYWPLNQMHGVDTSSSTFAGISDRLPPTQPLLADLTALAALAPVALRWRR